ncbi:MFS transporter [Mesorhizobium sp.]|uniref:MFS transporter n=1 Tax=Mesorhizobium sp. TaxID=1871066 RepID=UPI0025BAA38B|nr:MFS transporter [Mesorhizobium sp.]
MTFFACCAAHSGPIFHMVSYAMACGVAPMAAVSIYSVEGLAGLGGRLLYGVLGDRLGVKPVLITGLAIQAAVIAAYLAVGRLEQFYVLAVIFGATYGGVMPLYAVLAREYFGPRIIGTVFGAATMLSSLGMSFGPLAGGMIYDAYASYSWLFIGSALVGLGAAGIAIANGIRVDQHMQSSIPEILAVGDAASYRHWFTGGDVRLESVQNATDQARLAARTIVGHAEPFAAVPWFWSDIGDMKLQMVGLTQGGDSHVVLGEPAENRFSIYHYAGNRLLGIESVNRPADHMLGRKMLGAGFSPAPHTVAAGPDALKAALAAFSQDEPARASA